MITINAYTIKEGDAYNIQFKQGNTPIRCDSFKIRDITGTPNLIIDPINWIENMTPIKIPRNLKPVRSYYFRDHQDIWLKVGHSMDVLREYLRSIN